MTVASVRISLLHSANDGDFEYGTIMSLAETMMNQVGALYAAAWHGACESYRKSVAKCPPGDRAELAAHLLFEDVPKAVAEIPKQLEEILRDIVNREMAKLGPEKAALLAEDFAKNIAEFRVALAKRQ